jgi:hypothetical protein
VCYQVGGRRIRLHRARILLAGLRIWRVTLLASDGGLSPMGLPAGGNPAMLCYAPGHHYRGNHEAVRLTGNSGKCSDGTFFLFTECPRHNWEYPLGSDDFFHWRCRQGDVHNGLLCRECAGIGTFGTGCWTCEYDRRHVFWRQEARCRSCKVGLLTATTAGNWRCQVCGSPS